MPTVFASRLLEKTNVSHGSASHPAPISFRFVSDEHMQLDGFFFMKTASNLLLSSVGPFICGPGVYRESFFACSSRSRCDVQSVHSNGYQCVYSSPCLSQRHHSLWGKSILVDGTGNLR